MQKTLRRTVLAAGGTLLAGALARKYMIGPGQAEQVEPGHPPVQPLDIVKPHPPTILPRLGFLDADGTMQSLEQFMGHGLVLNLWATWCVPCVAEMPALDALARTLAPSGVRVLTVSLDRGGAAAVKPFYAAHGITSLPILLDPHSTMLAALGLDGIPTTLLVDKAGLEVARLQGPVDWASTQAAALVTKLIG
ncbi:MAG: TlpA disulfide reductase family protein [Janthinobacterium lividum]